MSHHNNTHIFLIRRYDEVWIWNDEMISWQKAYLEVSSKHLLWAFHDTAFKTKWTSLRVSKKQNVGRSHSYFTVATSSWRVEVRLARSRAEMWHNVLIRIGAGSLVEKKKEEDEKKEIKNDMMVTKVRRRASIGVVRENRNNNDDVKPIAFWQSLSKTSWMNDNASTSCMLCNVTFTLFLRRHHCRGCGCLVCDQCSKGRVRASKTESAQRACDRCVVTLFRPSSSASAAATAITSSSDVVVTENSPDSKSEVVDPQEKKRREKEKQFRKQLVETARAYEFQIRRQRRALAVFRSSHIERLELKCQDRDAERRQMISTPPTTPLMEKIKTAIIARRKISFSNRSGSITGSSVSKRPSTIVASPLLMRMR